MRKVFAYRLSDDTIHSNPALAQKAAQKRYDAAMTDIKQHIVNTHMRAVHPDEPLRPIFTENEAFLITQWIEENFGMISEAMALKRDMEQMEDWTNREDEDNDDDS